MLYSYLKSVLLDERLEVDGGTIGNPLWIDPEIFNPCVLVALVCNALCAEGCLPFLILKLISLLLHLFYVILGI